jgi:hypothetical protein
MQFVRDCRSGWVNNHPDEFDEKTGPAYLRDWIANYEISDWIKLQKRPNMAFVRTIDRPPNSCDHEELIRVTEEARFVEAGNIVVIDDPSLDEIQHLWHPSEWLQKNDGQPKVFVCDVVGHFVALKPVILQESKLKLLLVINSFMHDSIDSQSISCCYSMYFDHDSQTCYKSSNERVPNSW